jgi:hypothetical protein
MFNERTTQDTIHTMGRIQSFSMLKQVARILINGLYTVNILYMYGFLERDRLDKMQPYPGGRVYSLASSSVLLKKLPFGTYP